MKHIFIVSTPRTGTSYLLKLIEETGAIRISKEMMGIPLGDITHETGLFEHIGFTKAINKLKNLPDATYVEKTPKHIYYTEKIKAALPDATFLYIVKHPAQSILSYCKADFIHKFTHNPFEKGLQFWQDGAKIALNLNMGFINYDDLMKYPVKTTASIYRYCGLTGNATTAVDKHKKGEYMPVEGVYRYGEYDWKDYFNTKQKNDIWNRCGDLYKQLLNKVNI